MPLFQGINLLLFIIISVLVDRLWTDDDNGFPPAHILVGQLSILGECVYCEMVF